MKRLFVLAGLLTLAGGVISGRNSVLPVSSVHARVIRDFVLRYRDVRCARWVPNNEGSTMYFTRKGIRGRAVYDAKGKWIASF